ncbi:hypothetical protein EJD97_022258 [Solanum chilense]|uniref:Gag-pol polyprotein n=1 Tax=Solanum chilense TaxID=4083 RepID=A0A6N2AWE5_SOLCI|nr:hypothetical protein EJD97_022258 [Solanum chilense]
MANVGAQDNQVPQQYNQVPPLEKVVMGDQVLVVPPPMTDGEIKADFITLTQAMTSQDNVSTSQVQAMTTQMNREVGPRLPQHTNIVASHLRDFTRMNAPIFFGSKSDEDPQDFLDEV